MKSLFEFTQNICTFTLVMTLLLNIFPHSFNKKYVKLFAGILLICLIFNPIVNWKKYKFDIENMISSYTYGQLETDLNRNISELESKMTERLENEVE